MFEIMPGDHVKFVKYKTHGNKLPIPTGTMVVTKVLDTVRGMAILANDKKGYRWAFYMDEVRKVRKVSKTAVRLAKRGKDGRDAGDNSAAEDGSIPHTPKRVCQESQRSLF